MLEIEQLSIRFSSYAPGFARQEKLAIRSLDLRVDAGELLAVVGQSGAGKSLLAHALLGVLPRTARVSGLIRFKGRALTPRRIVRMRGKEIALVPQSMTFLNPLLRVGGQVARAARLSGLPSGKSRQAAREALHRYRLKEEVASWFPFQLSGGMARRVLTATATLGGADLILADEPTNGLDPETAGETLRHLRELADTGKAVVLITHDIEAALTVADRVTVFCGGVTVEEALASDFNGSGALGHPYSKALWDAVPGRRFVEELPPAAPKNGSSGCPFLELCPLGDGECTEGLPPIRPRGRGRVRCVHA